jgi:lysophospholipid acyltransferase (LPLAT)-like uncharacterized protein
MPSIKEKTLHLILRRFAPRLVDLLGHSIQFRFVNAEYSQERAGRGESCIFCFWHNRFLLMPYFYQRVRGRKNICVMASRSRDGEYISDVLKGFGFRVARGSSSRGGDVAVKEMATLLKSGLDAAVTPDGPRGPCYRVQPGVVLLSQLSAVPIVPVTYDVKGKGRLRSWDRFIVPMPFCRGICMFGEPLWIDGSADEEERKRMRSRLESDMRAMDARAASLLGATPD